MGTVISADGTRIAFDQAGQGAPLILVDGALCHRAGGPMPGLAPLLAQHFTVFTYDRRGRNESGDTVPYAVEREVEDLVALITEAGGSAGVYAISSGAALALEAAASGLNITKLALYEPPFNMDPAARPAAVHYSQQLRPLLAEGRRGDAVALFMTRVGMPAEAADGMRQSPMWPALEAVAPTLAY
ncbi:MAG: alpha/beta fold hydrolase, partial [Ktedonobacterales bacterium]|nr:alpha/beta fold hydrolase [Ktedonobacterales bacterium]